MVRGCKAFLTALVLLAGCSAAFAQETTIGAGKIEIGGFPGGGTFFVSGDDNTEVNFNVYTAGGDITYYINPKAAVEGELLAGFDWRAQLPERPERPGQAGLELVGERTCLYGKGRIAHVMYRHEGRPVSVFMLPHDVRRDEVVNIFGHHAAIWSVGNRTFVLIAREPPEAVERMASFVQASLR